MDLNAMQDFDALCERADHARKEARENGGVGTGASSTRNGVESMRSPVLTNPDPDDLMACSWCMGMKYDPDTADGFFSCHVCKGEGVRTRAEIEGDE